MRKPPFSDKGSSLYISFVEFINQWHLQAHIAIIALVFQSLCIFCISLYTIADEHPVVDIVQYLGIVPFFRKIMLDSGNDAAIFVLVVLFILILHLPIVMLGLMWVSRMGWIFENDEDVGKLLNGSTYFKFCRVIIQSNSYFFQPITTSLAAGMFRSALFHENCQNLCSAQMILSLSILILAPLTQLFYEYNLLDLVPPPNQKYILMRCNITSHLGDLILVYGACILNSVAGRTPDNHNMVITAGIVLGLLRLLIAVYMPYYKGQKLLRMHRYIICCYCIGSCSIIAIKYLGGALLLLAFTMLLWVALGFITFSEQRPAPCTLSGVKYTAMKQTPQSSLLDSKKGSSESADDETHTASEVNINNNNNLNKSFNNSKSKKSSFFKTRRMAQITSSKRRNLALKTAANSANVYAPLGNNSGTKQTRLEACQRILSSEGRVGYVFRQLLIYERLTTNHRQQLLIQFLKRRCVSLEEVIRGGCLILSVEDILRFQEILKGCVLDFAALSDHGISIMKFLESKESLPQIFQEQIRKLINSIKEVESQIGRMLQINRKSLEAVELSFNLYQFLMRDNSFLKNMEEYVLQHLESAAQCIQRKTLFHPHSSAIFINALQDIGKITRVSKNIEAVIGYSASQLIGLNINELMPHSLKRQHKKMVENFVKNYSVDTDLILDPLESYNVVSYAFDKDFTLQQVQMAYTFSITLTGAFEMCSLLKLASMDYPLVLLNPQGYLQGWTQDMGLKLGLSKLSQTECLNFNFLVMMPTLIKYFTQGITEPKQLRTVIFLSKDIVPNKTVITEYPNESMAEKTQNIENNLLSLKFKSKPSMQDKSGARSPGESVMGEDTLNNNEKSILTSYQNSPRNGESLHSRMLYAFERAYKRGDIDGMSLVVLNITPIVICEGKVKFIRIQFKRMDDIENWEQVICSLFNKGGVDELSQEESSNFNKSSYSFAKQSETGSRNKKTVENDFCFSPNVIRQEIEMSVANIRMMRLNNMTSEDEGFTEINEKQEIETRNSSQTILKTKNKPAYSGTPSLQRSTFGVPVCLFALGMIVLAMYDVMELDLFKSSVFDECKSVMDRNYYFMVFTKSAFNPNVSYIRRVDQGEFFEDAEWLRSESYNFKVSPIFTANFTKSYTFNVAVPTLLCRLLETGNYTQYMLNYYGIVSEFDKLIDDSTSNWEQKVWIEKIFFTIRMGSVGSGGILLVGYLIYVFLKYKLRNKIIDAFFKFEKTDLQIKTQKIQEFVRTLQAKAEEWYFTKYFLESVKSMDLKNLQYNGTSSLEILEPTLKFDVTQIREKAIAKKRLLVLLFFIGVFLFVQTLFFSIYPTMALNLLMTYQNIPSRLDVANKVMLIPNLQLASIFVDNPPGLIDKYSKKVTPILTTPEPSVPMLFDYLQRAPCPDCPFLYPLLTTNYRSFFSTFTQLVLQKKLNKDTNVTELFNALDVVVQNLLTVLKPVQVSVISPVLLLYVLSIGMFLVSGLRVHRKNNLQTTELQEFLKCFDQETLQKNKHLNNIVKKEI